MDLMLAVAEIWMGKESTGHIALANFKIIFLHTKQQYTLEDKQLLN